MKFMPGPASPGLTFGLILLFSVTGCTVTSIPPGEREQTRNEIDARADETIARFSEDPSKEEALAGFFIADVSSVNAITGASSIVRGVLVDLDQNTRTYMDVQPDTIAGGLPADDSAVFIQFQSEADIEKFRSGGDAQGLAISTSLDDIDVKALPTPGGKVPMDVPGSATALGTTSITLSQATVNNDLTDNGFSELSFPTMNAEIQGKQANSAPRKWPYILPFFGQEQLNKGGDLPEPVGIGITYMDIDQDIHISDLKVGPLGSGVLIPFSDATFSDAEASSQSEQLKIDAWILPFLNLFASYGKIEGDSDVLVEIDGDGALGFLGIDCSQPGNESSCNELQGKTRFVPLKTDIEADTYGVGAILAYANKNWFALVPANVSWIDVEGGSTGNSYTITPRGGLIFQHARWGKFAPFIGANYLETDLTVGGSVNLPIIEGGLNLDYELDQENKDNWTGVMGATWNPTRHISIMAEYNGITGSRDTFMATFGYRFGF